MKKSMFLTVAIAIVVVASVLLTSCGKKATEPDTMASTVTMTYTPNPATVNTPITFNFSVMENMAAVDVTEVTTGMMQGMTNMEGMMMSKTGTGMYMGEYTFTKSDSCKITFNYNHHGELMKQEFTIFVK